jgi:hypothetical protein
MCKNYTGFVLFKKYRTTQYILIDAVNQYSLRIATQQEQGDRTQPNFFIEISTGVFVESAVSQGRFGFI